jgi:transcriptional regulator with XRE-family HTH domain
MKNNSKIIGQALKEARERKQLTREQISAYTGMAVRTVQNIELGTGLSRRSLDLYFEVLNVKAIEIYVG